MWHQALIPVLPRAQLLGQHRECCALRGNGWGRKHATVDYVFTHPWWWLFNYHMIVMGEMEDRGYRVTPEWWDPCYRGKLSGRHAASGQARWMLSEDSVIYPEHDAAYLRECKDNLAEKGVLI